MQKDFHYDVVYVLAQWASFNEEEPAIIAYASQYVDDAEDDDSITFDNGNTYPVISSAHSQYDMIDNTDNILNKYAWVPFHFLPGNCMLPLDQNNDDDGIKRLICFPDSFVARAMVQECLRLDGTDRNLYRLGITAHVYADTWAHQGFCGVKNDINKISELKTTDSEWSLARLADDVENLLSDATNYLPLGHGPAVHYPDLPYLTKLSITYLDERGEVIRNNAENFVEAADYVYKMFRLFKVGNKVSDDVGSMFEGVQGLSDVQKQILMDRFITFSYPEESERYQSWQKEIGSDSIEGVSRIPEYDNNGEDSWRFLALGKLAEGDNDLYHYSEAFETSNLKMFYDALKRHQDFVLQKLLPQFGIQVDQYLNM